jgi:hypothetical protein
MVMAVIETLWMMTAVMRVRLGDKHDGDERVFG